MKAETRRQWALAGIHLFVLVSTVICTVCGVTKGAGEGQVGENMVGWGYLKAFTTLSNVFAAVVSGIALAYMVRHWRRGTDALPRWLMRLRYAATSAVGLTFFVVVVFLGPMFEMGGAGYFTLFRGDMFFLHLANPVLCGVALVRLERRYPLGRRDNLVALLPTVAYSLVYTYMVAIARRWTDFYNFTLGGHYQWAPVCIAVMYAVSYLIARAQRAWHNRQLRKGSRDGV